MYKVAIINHNDEIYRIINDTFKNYGIEIDITCFNDFMNIKKIFDFLWNVYVPLCALGIHGGTVRKPGIR